MSNETKKNRRRLSKGRLDAASRCALETMESRILMTGTASYTYVADQSTYNVPENQTTTVKLYLDEQLSGGAASVINAEGGLSGAAVSVSQSNSSGTAPTITAVNPDSTAALVTATGVTGSATGSGDFNGVLSESLTGTAATINEGSQGGVDTTNSSAPAGEIFLGTLTITAGSSAGSAVFSVGELNAGGGNTLTNDGSDLDIPANNTDPGFAADGTTALVGADTNGATSFTVNVIAPTPTVTVTAPGSIYNAAAYSSATNAVTGSNGADGSATVTDVYYAGTLSAGQIAGATPLSSAPTAAGIYTVVGEFAGDSEYSAANSAPEPFTISAAPLTATVVGAAKTYDSTTADPGATFTLAGVITPDQVSASGTAVFASASAGTSIDVNASGTLTLSGAEASDYSITTVDSGSANINQQLLTLTFTAAGKTYDGATADPGATYGLAGIVPNDTVTASGTATFVSADAGSGIEVDATGIALGGAQATDYSLPGTTATGSANIAQAQVTASATEAGKTYDGTTTAGAPTITLNGVVAADTANVTASGSAAFASAAAGPETVNVTGISLAGSASGNYSLVSTSATTSVTIAKAGVTASATEASKTYDGTTTAGAPTITLSGVIAADTANVTASGSAAFASSAVGNGVTVNVTGISLAGSAAGNYSLSNTTTTTAANITQATPTVQVVTSGASFAATIAGVNNVYGPTLESTGLTLAYYSGSLNATQLLTATPLGSAPSASGTYTVLATFAGSTDYSAVTGPATVGPVSNFGSFSIVSGAPTFPASYTFTPPETSRTNSIVGAVSATPAEPGTTGPVIYTLTGTNAADFAIGTTSGVITARNALDLAIQGTFSFDVIAKATFNGVAESAEVPVTVGVQEVLPTITDSSPNLSLGDNKTDNPLSGVTISDVIPTHTETVTVTLNNSQYGTLTDPSYLSNAFVETSAGVYKFTGTASSATSAIRALVYKPAQHDIAPGHSYATSFTISVNTPAITNIGLPVTHNAATTVTVTAVNTIPTLTGISTSEPTINDTTNVSPFSSATVTDPDSGDTTFTAGSTGTQSETVIITESNGSIGTITGGGFTLASPGVYSVTGTPAAVTADLRAAVFKPTANTVQSGHPTTETLTTVVVDSAGGRSSSVVKHIYIKPEGRITTLSAALTNPALAPTNTGPVTPAVVLRNTSVLTLTGNDPDSSDVLTYSLASGGTNNGDFYISGNLLKVALNPGVKVGTYNVMVKVADQGGDSVTQAFKIVIGATSCSVTAMFSPIVVVG